MDSSHVLTKQLIQRGSFGHSSGSFSGEGDGSSLELGATRCQLGKNLKPFSEAAFEVSAGHRRHFHGANGSCTRISKRRGGTETHMLHYNVYIQIASSLTCTEHPPSLELQLITNRFLPLECVISCAENLLGFFFFIISFNTMSNWLKAAERSGTAKIVRYRIFMDFKMKTTLRRHLFSV